MYLKQQWNIALQVGVQKRSEFHVAIQLTVLGFRYCRKGQLGCNFHSKTNDVCVLCVSFSSENVERKVRNEFADFFIGFIAVFVIT